MAAQNATALRLFTEQMGRSSALETERAHSMAQLLREIVEQMRSCVATAARPAAAPERARTVTSEASTQTVTTARQGHIFPQVREGGATVQPAASSVSGPQNRGASDDVEEVVDELVEKTKRVKLQT